MVRRALIIADMQIFSPGYEGYAKVAYDWVWLRGLRTPGADEGFGT